VRAANTVECWRPHRILHLGTSYKDTPGIHGGGPRASSVGTPLAISYACHHVVDYDRTLISTEVAVAPVVLVLAAVLSSQSGAPTIASGYLCSEITGGFATEGWRPDPDAVANESVWLRFQGDGKPADVKWYRGKEAYSESTAVGLAMKSGFTVLDVADDRAETYFYNAGTTELLLTRVRSGGKNLTTAVTVYRGKCVPSPTAP
jgi:hypothetical protein